MKMLRLAQVLLFFVYLENVTSYVLVHGVVSTRSKLSLVMCSSVCEKTFPLTSNKIAGYECCSRGCRYYGISPLIKQDTQAELNVSREACHVYCCKTYCDHFEKAACIMGCDSMAKHLGEMSHPYGYKMSKESSVLEIEDGSQTGEMNDLDDVLTDPALRRQVVDLVLFQEKRLPEMRVKTLPVDSTAKDVRRKWWWPFLPRRPDSVPHCLAASFLVFLILVILWFALGFEEKLTVPSPPICYDPEEAPPLPRKYSFIVEVKT